MFAFLGLEVQIELAPFVIIRESYHPLMSHTRSRHGAARRKMKRNGASASRSRTIMNDHVNTSDHVFTNEESDLQIMVPEYRPEVPDLKIN